jgi:UDP-N-acetylglucosamine--N-acetylmuramyl-(pentapeptide) pyrophosphoryl-undecaprenol N-acetylglucosamine transferase
LKTGNSCAEAAHERHAQQGAGAQRTVPVSVRCWIAKRFSTAPEQTAHARRPRVMPHLVIMAAGTGGHIIPGIAVAREVQRRGWSVSWLGTRTGMENKLVPPTGIVLDRLAFTGLRGKGLLHSLTGGLRLLKACWDSARFLRQRGADAVLGMGGYVCFPGGLMAGLLRKPLLLVNADAALLLSNKALLRVADSVAFGFDGPAARIRHGLVTGNPVRAEIEAIAAPAQRFAGRSGPLRLLVVGGSLGAQVLNRTLPAALALLPKATRPTVVHQTGAAQHAEVRAAYAQAGIADDQAEVLPFIDNMAERLADCDLIVCRAGAVTVSELCAAGVPSLLVPLVVSTTAHQRDNAEYMAGHGAARHLPQAELTAQSLAAELQSLNRGDLLAMAERAHALARPHAAARVADELDRLVNKT